MKIQFKNIALILTMITGSVHEVQFNHVYSDEHSPIHMVLEADKPILYLWKYRTNTEANGPKKGFVIPIIPLVKLDSNGKPENFTQWFQFSKTRLQASPASELEQRWYSVYDYVRPYSEGPIIGGRPTLKALSSAKEPNIFKSEPDRMPRLNDNFVIPECKASRYFVYKDENEGAYYLEIPFVNGTKLALKFREFYPVKKLFIEGCTGAIFQFIRGKPKGTLTYEVPGDVRQLITKKDDQSVKNSIYFQDDLTSLQAVISLEKPLDQDDKESSRLYFNFVESLTNLNEFEKPSSQSNFNPSPYYLGVNLRKAFFSASEDFEEKLIPKGAFMRLSSISLEVNGISSAPTVSDEKLRVMVMSQFNQKNSDKGSRPKRFFEASNIEQQSILQRLKINTDINTESDKSLEFLKAGARELLANEFNLFPVFWEIYPDQSVRNTILDGHNYYDESNGDQDLRYRERIRHRESNGIFRLLKNVDTGTFFYVQETEVTINQWKKFLSSKQGSEYLAVLYKETFGDSDQKELFNTHQWLKDSIYYVDDKLTNDLLRKFLFFSTVRKSRKSGISQALINKRNIDSSQRLLDWDEGMPMTFISVEDVLEYCKWVKGNINELEVGIPTAIEWKIAADLKSLKNKLSDQNNIEDLTWTNKAMPHPIHRSIYFDESAVWRSHDTLLSLVGNVSELVSNKTLYAETGGHFRMRNRTFENVSKTGRAVNKTDVSPLIGFRPVLRINYNL
jgi:formylglycine-generating enzyme required for sulfatase activity